MALSVSNITSLGQVVVATGTTFSGTTVGGLSGITYDAQNNRYFSISDDRSQINPARFYTLNVNVGSGTLTGVTFTGQYFGQFFQRGYKPYTVIALTLELFNWLLAFKLTGL